jgi:hypothetical protein
MVFGFLCVRTKGQHLEPLTEKNVQKKSKSPENSGLIVPNALANGLNQLAHRPKLPEVEIFEQEHWPKDLADGPDDPAHRPNELTDTSNG